MTIYVVTGRYRTGTSLLMKMLENSAQESFSVVRDLQEETAIALRQADSTYEANPGGFYAPPKNAKPHLLPAGSLIKWPVHWWPKVPLQAPGTFIVIQMIRPEENRVASMNATFGFNGIGMNDVFSFGEKNLSLRSDCTVIDIAFDGLFDTPLLTVNKIHNAIPLDRVAARSLIIGSLRRN